MYAPRRALAALHFAPSDLASIAVIGSGVQARWQLRLLGAVVTPRRLRCWARRREQAEAYASEMRAAGWAVAAAGWAAAAPWLRLHA